MNSDSLNMVSRLGEGHMPCNFFLSEPQLKTTVCWLYCGLFLVSSISSIELPKVQGVPHLHANHYHGFHYHGFWLVYMQVGDFCVSRGFTTVPLTRILCNTVFSKSQIACKAGTLCTIKFPLEIRLVQFTHVLFNLI